MPDYIGNVQVPEITPSGTLPLTPDYPVEMSRDHEVVVHQFGSGNAKIEQRFLLGTGARRWTLRKQRMRDAERVALRNFWESKYGPYGAFTFNVPRDDGSGTDPVICRFANEPLSWEMVADWACSLGVTVIEIPQSTPSYPLNQTVNRFPPTALQTAMLSQVQEIIPLIRIQPLEAGYPAIYLSDRRCTIGGQLYQTRLLEFDGISQSLGGESDEAQFAFGNADRVMRDLANDVDLFRAEIAFSLYHVGTGIKLDLWKGNIVNWSYDSGPEFRVTAADGLYELNLPYPTRKISRTCWKQFKGPGCPYVGPHTSCDKGFDTPNGCRTHGMDNYFGGIIAKPQGVRIKDNSTGVWGFGRSTLTSVSLVADSIYDQVVPEIYTDSTMPINAKIAMGRDESDFYAAVGIVGEGPLGAYGTGHKIDGQYHHGYPGPLGLLENLGPDPNPTAFGFDTDAPVIAERAAGTAFVMLRRSDIKGLQLSRLSEHAMEVIVAQGLGGWKWTAPGNRTWQAALTNPVWIAVNMVLRARGLRMGQNLTAQQLDYAETLFDVPAAVAAASICDEQVSKLVGSGNEVQFKFRGVLQEEKPLRDWLQEVLMNCLGYYTFANGKLKLGVRINSSAAEAFTEGNILFRSLQLAPLRPSFNHLTANFADEDYQFVANSVSLYDIDHANLLGGNAGPLFLKSTVNLSGTASKSQAARIITVRLREELGGITPAEWERARQIAFRTTVLALNTEPGMVCSLTHPDMPGGSGEFRVTGWRLNRDYSIDIQGRTTTDSMYDLLSGPKPADVTPEPIPGETIQQAEVQNLAVQNVELDDDAERVRIKLTCVAPQLEGLSHLRAYVEIPQEDDQTPDDPDLPGQLFFTGSHFAESGAPAEINLDLPYPPLQWLQQLPGQLKAVRWIIYIAASTWRDDVPIIRLTDWNPPAPAWATPHVTVLLDFTDWVAAESLAAVDPRIEESLTQIEVVGDDVRIRLTYHPVWPSLDLAAVHLYSSTEEEPSNYPHGRFPYEGLGQTLPQAYGYATARIKRPGVLPAKVALQIAGEWSNGYIRGQQRIVWENGEPQYVPLNWGTVVEITAESLSLGEPAISAASVEYSETESGWSYRFAFTVSGAVLSQAIYRGTDIYVRFAGEPEPATDDDWYALRMVAMHEAGNPATVYSPWYSIRPGTSAQFYARPVARGAGGARRWGAVSGPHSISLGLGSVIPGTGHNYNFQGALDGYWDDGNGVRLGKVDLSWTPLPAEGIVYGIFEYRSADSDPPLYAAYRGTEANTSESSITMWVPPPVNDVEYLHLALVAQDPAQGIWPTPADYAPGQLPVVTITLPRAGLASHVTGFSVTVETDDDQSMQRGRFVFSFTAPNDPNWHHVHLYRRPANAQGQPIADWLPDKVASIMVGGPGGWWPRPSQPEYWIFKAVSANSLGQENTANPPEAFVIVPTGNVTADKVSPGAVTGPITVDGQGRVTVPSDRDVPVIAASTPGSTWLGSRVVYFSGKIYVWTGTQYVLDVNADAIKQQLQQSGLTAAEFASGYAPVRLVVGLPGTYQGDFIVNQADRKLYRWNGAAYVRPMDGADVKAELVLDKLTAAQISAGAITTSQLAGNEISVGPVSGAPPRFVVKDSGGVTIGAIGEWSGFSGLWAANARFGGSFGSPVIDLSSSGAVINNADFTLIKNGITTSITNGYWGDGSGYAGVLVSGGGGSSGLLSDRIYVSSNGGSADMSGSGIGYSQYAVYYLDAQQGIVNTSHGYKIGGSSVIDYSRNANFNSLSVNGQTVIDSNRVLSALSLNVNGNTAINSSRVGYLYSLYVGQYEAISNARDTNFNSLGIGGLPVIDSNRNYRFHSVQSESIFLGGVTSQKWIPAYDANGNFIGKIPLV